MPDPKWFAAIRSGCVVGDPNMSHPLPSTKRPGWECALHRYPIGGDVWLWTRPVGERSWQPYRAATDEDVRAFERSGLIFAPNLGV